MNHLIAPSILAADFANLQRDIEMINNSQADWFHVDIMDGMFVPNISFGFPVVKATKKHAAKPLDVHLMIVDPDRYLKDFADAGADSITVHYEACPHLHRTVQAIKQLGCKAAVAINPATPTALLKDIIADVDMVLVMSVNPGFGGQKFIEHTYTKIAEVKAMSANANPNLYIEVDGGVDGHNIAKLKAAGANVFVAGNAVFTAADQPAFIASLKQA
ncbi:ribulose-phosphate 3-epimerase [Mucilaginibacter phyllosphaerae]|uniref:Ribulose-phosphate 3-epimerase n=1 Tax=Mucilaginibacter phyllosphaerae TaxID=1812349 RepID=A0A4Y8A7H3_9SPHI|nr:ribulose-phosphate 3-epimerase [Mucilaginibacter phyllosphaerae]MBB3970761.1 ribulose-phosphate 3-epimerase [Mucilaginibacter phyllosphaerae]TEW64296.1 ribulose-phosphate 3-epimerase [Mucilaginibacter phyllosphaerae]GGH04445.1 ribulose-phosphate 3-epimerase [Mucilaginibacter phyllosphaerae]